MGNNKMTKDMVPDNFTMGLALVDALPVIFFGASAIRLGILFGSRLFIAGAIACLLSGALKVLWKIIVVLKKKNVWSLFLQMRIVMPVSFVVMLISVFVDSAKVNMGAVGAAFITFPTALFLWIGILGMCAMIICAVKLDSSDVRANWIEQSINGLAQLSIFIGLLLC